jgi:cysteine desulfurase
MTVRRRDPVYLDYQATTPLDPAARVAMTTYDAERFGNPHSSTHRHGWEAAAGVSVARDRVASLVGCAASEVVFTSGATEANNLAIKGALEAASQTRRRLVVLASEHSCVLESAAAMVRRGWPVTVLGTDQDGLIGLDALDAALGDDVALVSVMAVNNEIGVIQPIGEIARRAKRCGALFHTDAAQAAGKIPLSVKDMGIDLMSLSAHKLYGPKGIGALIVGDGIRLEAQMHGGGQEGKGLRSGTLSPALCAGFGVAAQLAAGRMAADEAHCRTLHNHFLAALTASGLVFHLNGSAQQRWPGNLNIRFEGTDGARLIADLRDLSISSGAACASSAGKPSAVLQALGLTEPQMRASLRIGLGRLTSLDDVDYAAARLIAAVRSQVG